MPLRDMCSSAINDRAVTIGVPNPKKFLNRLHSTIRRQPASDRHQKKARLAAIPSNTRSLDDSHTFAAINAATNGSLRLFERYHSTVLQSCFEGLKRLPSRSF
jgi:hypothetical protein